MNKTIEAKNNTIAPYQYGTNQKDLAAGILKRAAQDLERFRGATSEVQGELYRDAYGWVTSEDCEWPFSFLNVCQLLNLTPEIVRLRLLVDSPVGFPTYSHPRCQPAGRMPHLRAPRVQACVSFQRAA